MKKRYILFIILFLLLFPKIALADFGPKTSLDIYVKNAPLGLYYLDLLVNHDTNMDGEYDPDGYNEELYRMLWDYDENGYWAEMMHQENYIIGLRGDLEGGYYGTYMLHSFVQVPSEFKIIIVSSNGSIRVSDVYRKLKFADEIYLDYKTMEITPAGNSIIGDWILQFLITLSATLLIEGIILLLFGFKLKLNWKPFLFVNLCTQIILIVFSGVLMVYGGAFAYIFLFGFIEAAIIIIESIAYKKLLRREKEGGRVAYAVTANLISILFTFVYLLS